MIVLSGADLVLPDRILTPGTLVVDGDRIVEIRSGSLAGRIGEQSAFAFHNHYIVPGFIDVHVHGVEGSDTLDGDGAIAAIAARLPRHGVAAFCPTTVACDPAALRVVLEQVRRARAEPDGKAARVLPAHLESNFINPEFAGAQPPACLRVPGRRGAGLSDRGADRSDRGAGLSGGGARIAGLAGPRSDFTAADILAEIERATPDVSIVTIAPELDGGLDLVQWLTSRGHHVSLGHSGADYDVALAAIAAGARQATHLFNRMPPLAHRAPGLVGAVLQTDDVAAELICDGYHVHPAVMRTAIAAKRASKIMAITDGTAVSGMPKGSRATLGGQPIAAGEKAAHRDDGTLAGSILTMDRAFGQLVGEVGVSLVDAAIMCATTPARELGLVGHGVLAEDAAADFVILDAQLRVVQTYVAGNLVYSRLS